MDVEGVERAGIVSELREAIRQASDVWVESSLGVIRQTKRQLLLQISLMRRQGWEYAWTEYVGGTMVIRGYGLPAGGPRQRRPKR